MAPRPLTASTGRGVTLVVLLTMLILRARLCQRQLGCSGRGRGQSSGKDKLERWGWGWRRGTRVLSSAVSLLK